VHIEPNRTDGSIRLLVVDDHAMVANALAAALGQARDIEVVATAGSVQTALACLRRHAPDVVLTDIGLPDGEVVDHLDRFATTAPGARVIVMTGLPTERTFLAAVRAGAVGYVAKSRPLDELVRAVQRVAGGEVAFPAEYLARLLEHGGVASATRHGPGLTTREIDVIQLLAHGKTTTEVARELRVAVNTVRNHLAGAMAKLGATNRLGAVSEALRLGIVSPPMRITELAG
jgi:DNA-binding NarL/FixJ family response regulator